MKLPTWTARNYQAVALSFLISHKRGGLFLDAGLGKTASVLALIEILKYAFKSQNRVLIIAPLRVCYSTWPNEIKKWANFSDLTHGILHGKDKLDVLNSQLDIYLINPEGLPWLYDALFDLAKEGRSCPFNTLIIDESTRFANPKIKDKRTKKLTRFGTLVQLLPAFNRSYIMTGTPCANSYMQLWSQIYILDQGASLGSNFYKFRREYFYSESWAQYNFILRDGAPTKIQKRIAHLILDMSTEGNVELPPITYNYIPIYFDQKVQKIYNKMQSDMFATIDDDTLTGTSEVDARLKCRQICNGSVYENLPEAVSDEELALAKRNRKTIHVHDFKIKMLEHLVNELNGKPILIVYDFKHDLVALLKLFGKDTPYIGSGVSAKRGAEIEVQWNAGEIQVLLGHPKSMAHGLNLQDSGNDICWFSIPESLELYIQFNKRIYRSGIKGSVRIHHLVAQNTLDTMLIQRLSDKAIAQDSLRISIRKYRDDLNATKNRK